MYDSAQPRRRALAALMVFALIMGHSTLKAQEPVKPLRLLMASLEKYTAAQNGYYSIVERSVSVYVADTSRHTEQVTYSFAETGPYDFPMTRSKKQFSKINADWIFHGDTMAHFDEKVGKWFWQVISKQEWMRQRNFYAYVPFTHTKLFLGKKILRKLSVIEETERHWVIEASPYMLWFRKEDTLLQRVDYNSGNRHQNYIRIDILEQDFNQPAYDDPGLYRVPDSATVYEMRTQEEEDSMLLSPGSQAIDWSLLGLEGDSIRLGDYRGKHVLLDFWYIGCKPCLDAMPHLQEMQEEYGTERLQVMGVETFNRDPEKIQSFLDRYDIRYQMVYGETALSVANVYGVSGYPTIFLINPEGKILQVYQGFGPSLTKRIESDIEDALEAYTGN